ncbi:unnamed protein product [Owenia fusiformis]|uniref:Alanine--glyoxylate aminotransferase n=1 Tax=Owenia fusiformis TaxID=6347 RepID=A0A8J1TA34_OWEFU|nr:unnamed protein product [Owenia fusiformis]
MGPVQGDSNTNINGKEQNNSNNDTIMPKEMYQAPACLKIPLTPPRKLLMGPGPSTVPPRILAASAIPLIGHMHPEMYQVMDEIKAGIQYVFQTQNELTLAISGAGHAAMEAAVCNLIEDGDVLVSFVAGMWGERFAEIGERHRAVTHRISKPLGSVFTLEEIEEALKSKKPTVMFIAQSESTGTILQPIEGIGELCRRYGTLLVVDSVASLGGTPMFMDEWGIDVLYAGSQKALNCPPGASPISFSQRARDKIAKRKTKVTSFYLDTNELANYWGCDAGPRRYHHTGPISTLFALREGLAILAEEGLEKSWEKHRRISRLMWEGVEALGLELFVKDEKHRLPTLTGIKIPTGVDWKKVCQYAMNTYKIEIAGGLGPESIGKLWRIGAMGYNATEHNVNTVLRVLSEGIKQCKITE